ncbi:MAG TPA: hypothetical protein VM074_09885 [Solimonas sp.]|nr:hypothetical protein [Solimonas sp.]
MRSLPLALLLLAAPVAAGEGTRLKLSADVGVELRVFKHNPAFAGQRGTDGSVWARPELLYEWNGGDSSFSFAPFARWDRNDERRTHADIRELALRHDAGAVEVHAGVRTVFWGATESVHLVNIVNQTDLVENPDGEDKLGQPMVDALWRTPLGNLEAFVLPYFRERTLPGPEARLRAPVPFDENEAIYESDRREHHVDSALRWSLHRAGLDLGLAYFRGTARAPRFLLRNPGGGPVLTPVYDQVEQAGLDASYLAGAWQWKLESLYQDSRAGHYSAAAGGFEYTASDVAGSGADLGWLLEYQWDERGRASPSPFQRDLYLGARLVANDEYSTEFLAGLTHDLQTDGRFGNLEASRRVGESSKLVLELRLFEHAEPADPLFNFRQDDYLQLEYVRFF